MNIYTINHGPTLRTKQIAEIHAALLEFSVKNPETSISDKNIDTILAGRITTKQDPRRIFQYYKAEMIAAGMIAAGMISETKISDPDRPVKDKTHRQIVRESATEIERLVNSADCTDVKVLAEINRLAQLITAHA